MTEQLRAEDNELIVVEQSRDPQGEVYYYGGLEAGASALFPISGKLQVEFNGDSDQYYTGERRDADHPHLSLVRSSPIWVYPYAQSVREIRQVLSLTVYSETEASWKALLNKMESQFPELKITQNELSAPAPESTSAALGMLLYFIGMAAGFPAVFWIAAAIRVRRGEAEWNTKILTASFTDRKSSAAVLTMILIPVFFVAVSQFQGIIWNAYTNYYYTSMFRIYGALLAGVFASLAMTWILLKISAAVAENLKSCPD